MLERERDRGGALKVKGHIFENGDDLNHKRLRGAQFGRGSTGVCLRVFGLQLERLLEAQISFHCQE